ncbi:MAG: Uma2 family endonuclease [Aphanocapsa sp. GSE-SYN-MK-11-07L]|jgi:Uma2 family endonuclease|nr:Uma2 family endonuclease [Aphanocapsa sp. GSE-SYN-MK-11-07L]
MQTQIPVTNPALTATAEQRLTLHNVSWDTYDQLLAAFGEHRAVHFHYDRGVLELMVPLEAHESPSDLIGVFIRTLAFEAGFTIKGLASTTLRRKALLKGAEPDKCYYLQHEPVVRGRTVNLDQDPPPDLVVEVDISHSDIDKNLLYAQMGVPELWRFDGQGLRIYQLQQTDYQEVPVSPTFPWVPLDLFYQFLQQCQTAGETSAYVELRAWVQAHAPHSPAN